VPLKDYFIMHIFPPMQLSAGLVALHAVQVTTLTEQGRQSGALHPGDIVALSQTGLQTDAYRLC
jgi:hypothetical protein